MKKNNNHKTAIVTGSSRGIGAEIAKCLSYKIKNIVIHYRQHTKRARLISNIIKKNSSNVNVLCCKADITQMKEIQHLVENVKAKFNYVDYLILNAAGGMEKNQALNYPYKINCLAQKNFLTTTMPIMANNGKVIYITSHQAHFIDQIRTLKEYKNIAESKKRGEEVLISYIPKLLKKNIKLFIVSGDLIKDTSTALILKRIKKNLFQERIKQAGKLYSSKEFAERVVKVLLSDNYKTGHIEYIGGADYLRKCL